MIQKVFDRLDSIFISHGLDYVNQYVESSIFTLLGTQGVWNLTNKKCCGTTSKTDEGNINENQ
jgi:hypothetical protein